MGLLGLLWFDSAAGEEATLLPKLSAVLVLALSVFLTSGVVLFLALEGEVPLWWWPVFIVLL
jgi:hypothetical protein